MRRLFSIKFIFTLAVTLVTASCGFHLRNAQTLPVGSSYVQVVAGKQTAPLEKSVLARMKVYQINSGSTALESESATTITLTLQPEKLDRRLLSVFATGQVAEYELIYGVRFSATFPDGRQLSQQFEVLREYQDDPKQVLAKSRELNLVLSEMRTEAADRIIRMLSGQL
ncbi:LPS assembly lipoprotein LptE [Alteromonas sp. AMM-1]|uniref:LPS-assembly lipoprotein LptE n=1 Tax=Alteromonas sp. AMM-1 TaxID=3394233 RepID=UPI0039A785A0